VSMSPNMGRPRTPASLKALQGTSRPGRDTTRAPAGGPVEAFPPPPAGLTEREAAAWDELAQVVGPMQVVAPSDMVAFRQMVTTLAVCEEARGELNANGLTYVVETASGCVVRKHPAAEILASFKKQLACELARFGLTPADRERVAAMGGQSEADPLDEFAVGNG
jgi:P27 family predicted phage terminase small subunit